MHCIIFHIYTSHCDIQNPKTARLVLYLYAPWDTALPPRPTTHDVLLCRCYFPDNNSILYNINLVRYVCTGIYITAAPPLIPKPPTQACCATSLPPGIPLYSTGLAACCVHAESCIQIALITQRVRARMKTTSSNTPNTEYDSMTA